MPTLNVNGADLHVLDEGKGPGVLFVHGFPLTHAMWKPQIEALSQDYRVIAPDLRGFGASSFTPGTVSMRQFADDLAGILDALDITEPVTFCGLSMGGYIGWQFVQNHSQRLRRLVCCDTKASADSEEAIQNRHKLAESVLKHGVGVLAQAMPEKLFAKETRNHNSEIVEQCQQMMRSCHPEGAAAALRGMAERPDKTELLPTIQVPTLVIVGEDDQITTVQEMREMADAIPNATFLEVPKAGHMAPLEQPEPVNAALKKFLEST